MKRPSLYWAGVLFAAAMLIFLGVQIDRVDEARVQALNALQATRQAHALADRQRREIDALQRACRQLQETLSAEQERFEACLAELGERNQ